MCLALNGISEITFPMPIHGNTINKIDFQMYPFPLPIHGNIDIHAWDKGLEGYVV